MSPATAPPAGSAWPAWTRSAGWVLGALAVWLLCTAWARPLLLPDEGRYGEVARQMWLGDGLVPMLNGVPFFHKPPLSYWVNMLGLSLFGAQPFSVRLAPALGAWLMGAALWLTLRRRANARVAGISLLVLATTPFFFIGGQYANHDMLVAGTITAAVLAFVHGLQPPPVGSAQRQPGGLRWLLLGWAFCGLALLSKGLIGVVLPALVIGPWLLVQGRWRDVLRLLHPLGLLVFVAVALPWLWAMQQRYADFFDYFIVEQHFRRFAGRNFNNVQPGWFYLWVLPFLTLPWSPALWAAAGRVRRALQPPLSVGAADHRRWVGLLLWWVLVVVGFFSLPASKLVGYIMPALAPFCALLALAFTEADAYSRARLWLWRLSVGAILFCLGLIVALAIAAPKTGRDVGQALRGLVTPADVVVLVEQSFNDVVFEARLTQVPLVATDWTHPDVLGRDSWRKELADTVRFDAPRVQAVMLPVGQLATLVCRGHRVWLVEGNNPDPRSATVPGVQVVLKGRNATLWRAEPQPCPPAG